MPSQCERHPCVICRPDGIPTAHAHVGTDLVAAAMQRSTLAATRTRRHQMVSASGCESSRCSKGLEVSSYQTAWQSRVGNALPSCAIADLAPGCVGGRYLPETSCSPKLWSNSTHQFSILYISSPSHPHIQPWKPSPEPRLVRVPFAHTVRLDFAQTVGCHRWKFHFAGIIKIAFSNPQSVPVHYITRESLAREKCSAVPCEAQRQGALPVRHRPISTSPTNKKNGYGVQYTQSRHDPTMHGDLRNTLGAKARRKTSLTWAKVSHIQEPEFAPAWWLLVLGILINNTLALTPPRHLSRRSQPPVTCVDVLCQVQQVGREEAFSDELPQPATAGQGGRRPKVTASPQIQSQIRWRTGTVLRCYFAHT